MRLRFKCEFIVHLVPVMSMGSRAKASSSLGTRVVCSVWSVVLGRGSTGPDSGLSGPPGAEIMQKCHEGQWLCAHTLFKNAIPTDFDLTFETRNITS